MLLLDAGTQQTAGRRLLAPGAACSPRPRSAAISWLAHSTLQSGVWVNSATALRPAHRERPVHTQPGVQASRMADRRRRAGEQPGLAAGDVVLRLRQGLRPAQPSAISARGSRTRPCPTSTTCSALQRLELAKPDRPPAVRRGRHGVEPLAVDPIPPLIDWDDVGNGSIFKRFRWPVDHRPRSGATRTGSRRRTPTRSSTRCTPWSRSCEHYGDDNLVLVVLGDHQPSTIVTG